MAQNMRKGGGKSLGAAANVGKSAPTLQGGMKAGAPPGSAGAYKPSTGGAPGNGSLPGNPYGGKSGMSSKS